MNDIIQELNIENMIYEIRGKQVMLDSDLAKLYQCSNGTKSINLAVKRHLKRFPERFMFQLTENEVSRFQFETLNKNGQKQGTNIKYLPYVFTEQGVAMLATVLRTQLAKEELIIIDSYADKHVLDIISKIKLPVTLVLSTKSRLSELDIDKYNKEYSNLTLIYNDTFHDRFIILDKKKMYHLGTSLNNAGTKTFAINQVEDKRWLELILKQLL